MEYFMGMYPLAIEQFALEALEALEALATLQMTSDESPNLNIGGIFHSSLRVKQREGSPGIHRTDGVFMD